MYAIRSYYVGITEPEFDVRFNSKSFELFNVISRAFCKIKPVNDNSISTKLTIVHHGFYTGQNLAYRNTLLAEVHDHSVVNDFVMNLRITSYNVCYTKLLRAAIFLRSRMCELVPALENFLDR